MKLRKEKGFTLIELMIVVAIIGILAAVAIPKFADLIDKAKEAATKGKLGSIRSAVAVYYGSYEGLAPADLNSDNLATAIVTDGDNMSKIPGGVIPTISATIADDSATGVAYSGKGSSDISTDAWAYDPSELEVWVEHTGTDTSGSALHSW